MEFVIELPSSAVSQEISPKRRETIASRNLFEVKKSELANWCDLLPGSRYIRLDIDISIAERNMDDLLRLGSFSDNSPELYTYDQLVDSTELLDDILNGDRFDLFIDDDAHFDDAILTT